MYYILEDRKIKEVDDISEWASWIEKQNMTICRDTFGDIMVSTVFLGIDNNFSGGGPILFETMIFGGEEDRYQERYHTIEQAEIGHKKACDLVKKSLI